jgi:phytoene desaturase
MSKKAIVIGSGIAGLSSACFLAKHGMDVTVLEKNKGAGGRASVLKEAGFTFDMGPSWYWMPDVFDRFFASFGKSTSDYYQLKRLDPSYTVFFGEGDRIDIPASIEELYEVFESLEPGSSRKLQKFLSEAKYKYDAGMNNLVYKPGLSLTEFMEAGMFKAAFRMHLLRSFSKHVRSYFKSPRIIQLLEFPVLFLGAMPSRIPALYSLMNYADISLGTWYPMGGMYKIVEGMHQLAASLGVQFEFNVPVSSIETANNIASGVVAAERFHRADYVVSGADYHHTEQKLLKKEHRMYSDEYWKARELAPSCLIFYIGLDKKIKGLQHHNLFFDEHFNTHLEELFVTKKWPAAPLFYVSCTSVTDSSVAPEGHENLFILIPVSPGLDNGEELREHYYDLVMKRMEKITGQSIAPHVIYKRSYAHSDFIKDYNAYRGNAYGLANTLRQTSILRPRLKSKKVTNLFFTGQFTVPGPGVPPALISGQVAAGEVIKHAKMVYEKNVR